MSEQPPSNAEHQRRYADAIREARIGGMGENPTVSFGPSICLRHAFRGKIVSSKSICRYENDIGFLRLGLFISNRKTNAYKKDAGQNSQFLFSFPHLLGKLYIPIHVKSIY